MHIEKHRHRRSSIGLTSLIDVVFILLLFFMLSTQFTDQHAVSLKIPGQRSTADAEIETDIVSIKLIANKLVTIDDSEPVRLTTITDNTTLRTMLEGGYTVTIDAEDVVPLQSLISLTDILRNLGFNDVSLRALR